MKVNNINIIAPSVFNEPFSEAEVLGAMVWLWSQFDYYGDAALKEATQTIVQTIHSGNFALFLRDGQPIGYVNWAYLDADEMRKCKLKGLNYNELIKHQKKAKDKQVWLLSLFCLSGHHNHFKMYHLLRDVVFKGERVHFAYHKSKDGLARFYSKQC